MKNLIPRVKDDINNALVRIDKEIYFREDEAAKQTVNEKYFTYCMGKVDALREARKELENIFTRIEEREKV